MLELPTLDARDGLRSEDVRRTLADVGCVLIRGALPTAIIERLATAMNDELVRQGYATEGGDWTGMPVEDVDDDAVNMAVPYLDLWDSPEAAALFETVLGEPAFVFRNALTRYVTKAGSSYITGAHQDAWLVKPNTDFVTVWTPLRPCTAELGGVTYALGSQSEGLRDHVPQADLKNIRFDSQPQLAIPPETISDPWAYSEVGVGDAIFFNAFTVHRSVPNSSERVIRYSIDTRFQPATSERGFTATHTMAELKAAKEESVHAGYAAAKR